MQNESIFADGALDRIFYGELQPLDNQVRGFRLNSETAHLRGCELLPNSQTALDAFGAYKASVRVQGVKRRQAKSAFFPATWTREQVINEIAEAYESMTVKLEGWNYGETFNGMKIRLEIDKTGRIADAKPVLTALLQAKSKKKRCDVCGQSKISICPSGHNQPYAICIVLPKWVRRSRRYLRWRYFQLFN
jgi:hypothetical protein